jgi:hypothetical protein
MKIEELPKRTNLYGYEELKCPVCGEWHYERTIKFHIAKKAFWCKEHKKFYIANTKIVKVRKWL